MTLEQLRAFVAVAESLNMTRAGERLHLSQPAVSAAIASLEGRYRTLLFDRQPRGLELTQAGHMLLPQARLVLEEAQRARQIFDDLSGLVRGELRIFASQTIATYWLPPRLASFANRYEAISVRLSVGNTAQVVDAVNSGEVDLGFVEGMFEDERLDRRRVGGDSLGLYLAPDHPLAGARIGRDEIFAARWVLREPGSGTRDHFVTGLDALGLTLRDLDICLELPSNGAALEAARSGGLIAVVSSLAAQARLRAGHLAEAYCDLPPRNFHLVRHRARALSAAARAFEESLAV